METDDCATQCPPYETATQDVGGGCGADRSDHPLRVIDFAVDKPGNRSGERHFFAPSSRRSGSIAVAGFPKLSSAFATPSLGVTSEVETGQLARIVEREPTLPLAI